jgi:CubicO group peptidase (beta-lactamase class C family)
LIERARTLCTRLSDLAREYRVCGAQLAIQHHDEIATGETGVLEYGGGHQVTRDSAFPIGSITRAFTATLVMTMVADGEADLDKPLGSLLSEPGDLGGRLTLRQLLSHTAGLGYVLAGRAIGALTGMSWPDAVEWLLLEPLGIEAAFIHPAVPGAAPRALATGHSVAADRTWPVQQSLASAEAPAGALAASASDLLELGRLHLPPGSPWLLPPELARLMREPVPEADPFGLADGWGLGLAVFRGPGRDWAGHDGNADGTSCHLRIDPEDGWGIALTTNTSTGTALWRRLCTELAEAGVPLPPECTGTYATGTYANGHAEAGER